MSQAILITAYKNYQHLIQIIEFFDSNFEIYIHIDKKRSISKMELQILENYEIVRLVSRKYKVNWGGLNHLKAILFLSEKALENPNNYYYHLISGHDFPIKKSRFFLDFFWNSNFEFIESFVMPHKGWVGNGGMDRIDYYNFFDLLNWKNEKQRKWIKRIVKIQKKIGFRRIVKPNYHDLYGGSTWWSLSRDALNYVIQYTKTKKYLINRFKHTFCPEEFYFQTILMNSKFKNLIQCNNLRYIDWSNRNGNNPSILDNSDLTKILKSDAIFARRFEYPISETIIKELKKLFKK